MKIGTYLALIGANGKAAKLAAENQVAQKPPFQRSFGKLRRNNPQCPECKVPKNANGNCYNRKCLFFEGHKQTLARDLRLDGHSIVVGSQPAAQPRV